MLVPCPWCVLAALWRGTTLALAPRQPPSGDVPLRCKPLKSDPPTQSATLLFPLLFVRMSTLRYHLWQKPTLKRALKKTNPQFMPCWLRWAGKLGKHNSHSPCFPFLCVLTGCLQSDDYTFLLPPACLSVRTKSEISPLRWAWMFQIPLQRPSASACWPSFLGGRYCIFHPAACTGDPAGWAKQFCTASSLP